MKKKPISKKQLVADVLFGIFVIIVLGLVFYLFTLDSKPTKPINKAKNKPSITQTITPSPTVKPIITPQALETMPPEYQILNIYRLGNNAKSLNRNELLEQSAQQRAYHLAIGKDQWSHEGYVDKILAFYRPTGQAGVGENLARNYTSFIEVLEAWKNSETHNKVMLKPFCEVGIGHYDNYWVAHFGIDTNNNCND